MCAGGERNRRPAYRFVVEVQLRDQRFFPERAVYYSTFLVAESPERLEDGGYFEELVQAAEFAALSRDEKRNYLNSVKMKGDYQNTIDFAREQGFEQGHEAGVAEGREIGVAEGMKKGRFQAARKMLSDGVSAEQIAKWTGLSEEIIGEL